MSTRKRTTASAVITMMTPAQREAMLTYFHERWESDAQTGALDELTGIDRSDLAEAWALIGREWNGTSR